MRKLGPAAPKPPENAEGRFVNSVCKALISEAVQSTGQETLEAATAENPRPPPCLPAPRPSKACDLSFRSARALEEREPRTRPSATDFGILEELSAAEKLYIRIALAKASSKRARLQMAAGTRLLTADEELECQPLECVAP